MFQKLSENKAKYILIDFIDERFKLIKLQEFIFTFSSELENSEFFKDLETEYIDRVDIDELFWKDAIGLIY